MADARLQRTRDAYPGTIRSSRVFTPQELTQLRRLWAQSYVPRFPLRTRWSIVVARSHRVGVRTWREVWLDLIYLVRG